MSDDEPKPGSAEDQGPVTITPELADRLAEKRTELFEEFEIRDEFPNEVLREAETRTEDVYEEIEAEIDERKDLRDLTTWTTDPIDAQDFDDAISIEREEGAYRLWVHIADVTHYVTPDTAMWEEAVKRANTVYLPDYTIHMLPPVLAETVCSLVPNEDRLCTHRRDGDRRRDALVRGHRHLQVRHQLRRAAHLQGVRGTVGRPLLPLGEENELAYELADRMHEQRKEDGSLVLNPRSRPRTHHHRGVDAESEQGGDTHPDVGPRRRSDVPRPPAADARPVEQRRSARSKSSTGSRSPATRGGDDPRKAVNAALETAPDRQLNKIQRAVLKVMPRAKYMNDPFGGHHALNFDIYGHFTSPIRRLSDTINHWIVHENDVPENILELCDHASDKQKDGETAERLYKQFLQEQGLDPLRSTTAGSKSLRTRGGSEAHDLRGPVATARKTRPNTNRSGLSAFRPSVLPRREPRDSGRGEGAEGRDTREDEKELSWSRSGEDRPRERSAQRAETEDPEVRVAERDPARLARRVGRDRRLREWLDREQHDAEQQ